MPACAWLLGATSIPSLLTVPNALHSEPLGRRPRPSTRTAITRPPCRCAPSCHTAHKNPTSSATESTWPLCCHTTDRLLPLSPRPLTQVSLLSSPPPSPDAPLSSRLVAMRWSGQPAKSHHRAARDTRCRASHLLLVCAAYHYDYSLSPPTRLLPPPLVSHSATPSSLDSLSYLLTPLRAHSLSLSTTATPSLLLLSSWQSTASLVAYC